MRITRAVVTLAFLGALVFTGLSAADGRGGVPVTTLEPVDIPLAQKIGEKPTYLSVEFDKFTPDKQKRPVAARVELVSGLDSVVVGRFSFFPIEDAGQGQAYRTDVTDAIRTLFSKAPGGSLSVRISLVPIRDGTSADASVTIRDVTLGQ